jgi:hypothetical protein
MEKVLCNLLLTDTIEIMLGESHAKELQKTPLPDSTVGGEYLIFSEDLCDQMIDKRKTCRLHCKVREPTELNMHI